MKIGKVTGTVVSTTKFEDYRGFKLLKVRPIDLQGEFAGEEVVAVQESLDMRRFSSPLVQFMLPYRMPRRTR